MTKEEIQSKLNIKTMISFFKDQPTDEEYNYVDPQVCPIALIIGKGVTVFPDEVWHKDLNASVKIPRELNMVVLEKPHTYGAALERAMKLMEGQSA